MTGVLIGLDSSTQACKVAVVDARTGLPLASGYAPHPDGSAVDPRVWVEALRKAWDMAGAPDRRDILGVGVSAQQHGMVAVDQEGQPVHDALLWNDTRSAAQAERMAADLGVRDWMERTGVLPVAAITLTKLAWLREAHPEAADRVHRVMLPHDWLLLHLTGEFATDRSDASGTGYFDAVTDSYCPELLERYFGAVPELPLVLEPGEPAGSLRPEWGGGPSPIPVSAGSGDNAGAAFGLELQPGEVAVSVGTSGTVFSRSIDPVTDPTGAVAGFADAAGAYLPLLCTLNAARVITSTAKLLSVDLPAFETLALAGSEDAGGLTMLPYLDGERTPNLPGATGQLQGLTRASMTPKNLARAAVLAVANSLADCLDVLRGLGVPVEQVLLIGGGANSAALRAVMPDTFGVPVVVPRVREYVALGAARQAAWAATGSPPHWGRQVEAELAPANEPGAARYRERYGALRTALTDVHP
jgi:xylulokinase